MLPVAILLGLVTPSTGSSEIGTNHHHFTANDLRGKCGCLLTQCFDDDYEVLELAHYTVKEYLYSDRMARGPMSRFALSEFVVKREFCRQVLTVACEAEGWDKTYALDNLGNLGPYCVTAAEEGLLQTCEETALEDCQLQRLYLTFLDPSRPSWDMLVLQASASLQAFPTIPYGELPENGDVAIFANTVSAGLFPLARKFLGSRDADEILYRTLVHVTVEGGTIGKNIMDLFREWPNDYFEGQDTGNHINFFPRIVEIATELRDPTWALCMYIGTHHHRPEPRGCGIGEFLNRGADPNAAGYRITPLQMAVYRLDASAVEELLDGGADANGIGVPDGDIVLDGDFDAVPSNMPPKSLVRNLRSFGVEIDCSAENAQAAELIGSLLTRFGGTEE